MWTKRIGPITLAWRSLIIIILNIKERGLARSWWFREQNHYLLQTWHYGELRLGMEMRARSWRPSFPGGMQANLGVSKGDLAKGSKVLRKVGEQEPKAGEFQGRAEGVVECEVLHIAAGPNAQVHG